MAVSPAMLFEVWWKTKRLQWWTLRNQLKDHYLGRAVWRVVGEPQSDYNTYTTPEGNVLTIRVVAAYFGRVRLVRNKHIVPCFETDRGIVIPANDLTDAFRRWDALMKSVNELQLMSIKVGRNMVRRGL